MQFQFVILDWSAYADGLAQRDEWLAWARGPGQLPPARSSQVPSLAEMPAMMRRRLDRMGRMACHVAYACTPPPDAPLVFASRYGEACGSLALLDDLTQGQALSPTGFGLSVHNAISALYSIAKGHTGNTVVVAAGRATVAAALTEAAALLADGAAEVLVVYYEAPLPDDYANFEDEAVCEYAWAWRVAGIAPPGTATAGPTVSLTMDEAQQTAPPAPGQPTWPAGLAVLRHMLQHIEPAAEDAVPALFRHDRGQARWEWRAHA